MKEIGRILQKAREGKRLTIERVHTDTKIPREYIESLELGDESKIPAEVYYIGSLRRYAVYLGLNADELIENYHNYKISGNQTGFAQESKEDTKIVKVTFISLIVSILGIGVFGFLWYRSDLCKQFLTKSITAKPQELSAQTSQTYNLNLQIESLESTWIKIISDDKMLFEGTLYAGQKELWTANDKFWIKIGYTRGVKVRLNNVPIDVTKGARQDVNELVLTKDSIKHRGIK